MYGAHGLHGALVSSAVASERGTESLNNCQPSAGSLVNQSKPWRCRIAKVIVLRRVCVFGPIGAARSVPKHVRVEQPQGIEAFNW